MIFLLLYDILLPGDNMNDVFAHYIKSDEIVFKHAKGMRDIIGKEFHLYHEIFLFLGGEAEFISEQAKQQLVPNTCVLIPKETFHQFFVSGSDDDYCRCVLNFDTVHGLNALIDSIFTEIKITHCLNEEIVLLFKKLIKTTKEDRSKEEKQIMLNAVFAQLLLEMQPGFFATDRFDERNGPVTDAALQWINENIAEPLSVRAVANHLHLSESRLSHVFKNDMHISVYQYILQKKLICANQKINQGIPPMQAAAQCGFQDYSGFYRIYKKMFGVSPSKQCSSII